MKFDRTAAAPSPGGPPSSGDGVERPALTSAGRPEFRSMSATFVVKSGQSCRRCGVKGHNRRTCTDVSTTYVPPPKNHLRDFQAEYERRARLRSITRAKLAPGRELRAPDEVQRPKTRGDCVDGERPCPWVGCKFSLYLDISPSTGSIKLNYPDLEPWEMAHSCSLDVADNGPLTLEEVGVITNLTRERIRQLEAMGLLKLKKSARSEALE